MNLFNRKKDFPIFETNPELIYLDSAASTQKPRCVIDAVSQYYEKDHANVHRGIYQLSERATRAYENGRQKVAQYIHAQHTHEIIFTRGTTESINLVAHSFGALNIKAGDEIILSVMEHHSNIVPWQMVCERTGAVLKIIPLLENGALDFDAYVSLLNSKTKLVSIIHVSNVLGTINPVKKMIQAAHAEHIPVLIDGAQAIAHIPVDVGDLDCDFYVFSSHKLYGPTGVGVLYGKTKWLERMPPYQTGGDMIRRVSFEKTVFNDLPYKFEAGTPNIAGVVGLGAAIDYINSIGWNDIQAHEQQLLQYAMRVIATIDGIKLVGLSQEKRCVIAFTLQDTHPHDIATILDQSNIAIRAGHHCAMPLMDYLKVPALSRISFGIYNELSDIDKLTQGLEKVREIFV